MLIKEKSLLFLLTARTVQIYGLIIGGSKTMKTLSEVVEIVGMTRRVIQEYEKAGLASTPSTKNKYGHLLYDDESIGQLWQIRFYRELGYNKDQMKSVFSNPDYNKHDAIATQVVLLERKKERLEALIETAKALNEMDLSPSALRFGLLGMEDTSYDTMFSVVGVAFSAMQSEDVEESFVSVLTEEDGIRWFDAVKQIIDYFAQGMTIECDDVQNQVKIMHSITSKEVSDSIILFSWNNLNLSPGTELAMEVDEVYGTGSSEFLFQATHYYCIAHADNQTDRKLIDALQNIEYLGRKRYTTGSKEVQDEVRKIHEFFAGIAIVSQDTQLKLLTNISALFGSKAYKDMIDNGAEKGVSWFISRAIRIYCNRVARDK